MMPCRDLLRFIAVWVLILSASAWADLQVMKIPAAPVGPGIIVSQTQQDTSGNTRFRFYPNDENRPLSGVDVYASAMPGGVPNAQRFRRDRDLGQVFTVPAHLSSPLFLDAVTLRVGPTAQANEGAAGGAKVHMQLYQVNGTPTIHNNGTTGNQNARWATFAPTRASTDDYVVGDTFTLLAIATGGVLPQTITTNDYMRWDLSGSSMIPLVPGQRYAFMVGFDEPAENRGLALANRNTAGATNPIPFGPYTGGYAIRRDGSNTDFHTVFFDSELDDPADRAASLASAVLPQDLIERAAIPPSTLGYPDVDTYRDFVFFIHAVVPEPGSVMLIMILACGLLHRHRA